MGSQREFVSHLERAKKSSSSCRSPCSKFAATGWEVPLSVDRFTGLLGQAMIPTMIVSPGVQLSSVQKLELNVAWIACDLRLLLAPCLAYLRHSFFNKVDLSKILEFCKQLRWQQFLPPSQQLSMISFLISSQLLYYSQQYLVCLHLQFSCQLFNPI